MSATFANRAKKRSRSRRPQVLQKPRGTFHPRVQKVGPEHFGIVSVDCAKARSKWMLCDFYGNVVVPPTVVAHNRHDLDAAVAQVRRAMQTHDLKDLVVAIERTGRYHHPPRQVFAAAGLDVRILHPFATKQFRQPSDPGNKTDDTDLVAIHRATASGFALTEASLDENWATLQLVARYRRDLVQKSSTLCTQIREHLDAALPGYAACFEELWDSEVAWQLLRHFDSAAAMLSVGVQGLANALRQAKVRFQQRSVETVYAWAQAAAAPDQAAPMRRRIALALDLDRRQKAQEIQALERDLAGRVTRTPYVLLLSLPGINIVSAAELAGEMGPIRNYANARAISGRAGLRPSRYQSDAVDHANGPLVRCANRRLRAVLMFSADNLIHWNQHFRVLVSGWRLAGKDARHNRVKIASRFCRILYQIVAGGQVCRHPSIRERSYVIEKVLAFHLAHQTPLPLMLADMQAAIEQLPKSAHREEARPLEDELNKIIEGHRRGPQLIGDILPIVLARLGVRVVQSEASGESNSQ